MTGVRTGHSFADAVALGWLGSQPIGSVNASATNRVARTWGWNPPSRGSSAPGMADRRLHSKDRQSAITVNRAETAGCYTRCYRVCYGDGCVTAVLRSLLPILLHV